MRDATPATPGVGPEIGRVTPAERAARLGQRPLTVWFTGLPASGKSTLAKSLELRLHRLGRSTFLLDGDNLRVGLSSDLGFSPEDRHENIRRTAEAARLMNDAGLVVLTAFISPYRQDRRRARAIIGEERFFEVHVDADLATCESRDPKGLYAAARAGRIAMFTGVSAPYEPPEAPHLVLETSKLSVEDCVDRLLEGVCGRIAPE